MSNTVLKKQPAETCLFDMDFSRDMISGDTIASIDSIVITPSGVTKTSEAFSGQIAQAFFSGGTDSNRYKVTFTVTTALGEILEGDGEILVDEK